MAEIHLGEPEWSRGSAATAWFPPDSVGMAPPIAHLGLNEKIADPTTAYLSVCDSRPCALSTSPPALLSSSPFVFNVTTYPSIPAIMPLIVGALGTTWHPASADPTPTRARMPPLVS